MCHVVLMLPILGLALFWFWPFSVAAPAYAACVVLSAFFYFAIIRAMKKSVQTGVEGLMYEKVKVLQSLNPEGHVRVHGEIWKAVSQDLLHKDEHAEIVGIEGLTLQVRKCKEEDYPNPEGVMKQTKEMLICH